MSKKIPEGFSTVTPTLVLSDAAKAIDLYVKAFGAKEQYRMPCANSGKIMHACITIGTSKVFLADTNPEMGCGDPSNSVFYLYVEDTDATFLKATEAGMQANMAPQDMFWGDRNGNVQDMFGIRWTIATHVRDVSPEEMEEGRKNFAAKMGKAA